MAVRKTILFVGDSNCAGGSGLAALNTYGPQYLGAQSNYKVWNSLTSQWELYNAGVNSCTTLIGSDAWSFEVVFRHAFDNDWTQNQELFLIKAGIIGSCLLPIDQTRDVYGVATGLAYTPSWWPPRRDQFGYVALMQQLKLAAAAANLAGDVLEIVAIPVVLGTVDAFAWGGSTAFAALMSEFLFLWKLEIANVPYVTLPASTPIILVRPHNAYATTPAEQYARVQAVRAQFQGLNSPEKHIKVLNTDFATAPDNIHYSAPDSLTIGSLIMQLAFFEDSIPGQPDVQFDEQEHIVLLIGDSIGEGHALISELPTYLQGAQSGVSIWRPFPTSGDPTFEPLEPDVNNQTNHYPSSGLFGLEVGLGEHFRRHFGKVSIIKACFDGTCASMSKIPLPPPLMPPFFDENVNDWNPASYNELYTRTIDGWAQDALTWITNNIGAGYARVDAIVIALGTNDASVVDGGTQAREAGSTIKMLINRIRAMLRDRAVDGGETVKVVLVQPSSDLNNLPGLTENHTDIVRAGLRAVAEEDPTVGIVDTTGYTTVDGVHFDTESNLEIAEEIFTTWRDGVVTVIQPLFVVDRTTLRKALRLSAVSDSNDADQQIDEALQAVKVGLYRRLGTDRIAALQAIAFNPAPTSEPDYLRLLAVSTEIKWVRLELMRVLPMMFMDGSNPNQAWQEEAAFRELQIIQQRDEMRRLQREIDDHIFVLSGEKDVNDISQLQISLIENEDTTIDPGDTIRVQGGVI